jgi:hypothetical protein
MYETFEFIVNNYREISPFSCIFCVLVVAPMISIGIVLKIVNYCETRCTGYNGLRNKQTIKKYFIVGTVVH